MRNIKLEFKLLQSVLLFVLMIIPGYAQCPSGTIRAPDGECIGQIEVDFNSIVVRGPINVRSKLPSLEKRAFLKWEWDFGKVLDVLKVNKKIQVLERTTIAENHIWARIRYEKNNEIKEGYIYVARKQGPTYIKEINPLENDQHTGFNHEIEFQKRQSDRSPWSFLKTAHAGELSEESGEIENMGNRPVKFTWDCLILTIILFSQSYTIFRFFPIQKEGYKIHVFYILNLFTLLIWGLFRAQELITLLKH